MAISVLLLAVLCVRETPGSVPQVDLGCKDDVRLLQLRSRVVTDGEADRAGDPGSGRLGPAVSTDGFHDGGGSLTGSGGLGGGHDDSAVGLEWWRQWRRPPLQRPSVAAGQVVSPRTVHASSPALLQLAASLYTHSASAIHAAAHDSGTTFLLFVSLFVFCAMWMVACIIIMVPTPDSARQVILDEELERDRQRLEKSRGSWSPKDVPRALPDQGLPPAHPPHPTFEICSRHGQMRTIESLVHDEAGRLICAPGRQCKDTSQGEPLRKLLPILASADGDACCTCTSIKNIAGMQEFEWKVQDGHEWSRKSIAKLTGHWASHFFGNQTLTVCGSYQGRTVSESMSYGRELFRIRSESASYGLSFSRSEGREFRVLPAGSEIALFTFKSDLGGSRTPLWKVYSGTGHSGRPLCIFSVDCTANPPTVLCHRTEAELEAFTQDANQNPGQDTGQSLVAPPVMFITGEFGTSQNELVVRSRNGADIGLALVAAVIVDMTGDFGESG